MTLDEGDYPVGEVIGGGSVVGQLDIDKGSLPQRFEYLV
jgi:hypothetical protein